MPDLGIIVPSRSRPANIAKVIGAWDFTNAWDTADLIVAVDKDDPQIEGYRALYDPETCPMILVELDEWVPMVHKLDAVARSMAPMYFALGFAGDDHLPRTINWAARYVTVLRELGTGMVHGDDGIQGANLSTEWAVTSDAILALGRMVPAPVEHMYCDNSIMELFSAAGRLRYLPEIRVEHMHPIAKKAPNDDQYKKVNSREQFHRDRLAYQTWQRRDMALQLAALVSLAPALPPAPPSRSRPRARPATISRKVVRPMNHSVAPRLFRRVKGATPDEIGMALADFATQVPADQGIVELGVYQGRTALLMAWGARQGLGAHVWGFDAWELAENTYGPPFKTSGSRSWAFHHVQNLGYSDDITLKQGFSLDEAAKWEGPIGLLFIDADHSYEGARGDFLAWAPHLAPGAVVAFDDYGHEDWPGVKDAVDDLVSEGVLEPVKIYHDRLAVTSVKTSTEGTSLRSPDLGIVQAGEVGGVPGGTSIDDLNLGQLRPLAKLRGIVLGARKDKRSEILDALRAGE
jgi:predicted O-methyltransferase YrrM